MKIKNLVNDPKVVEACRLMLNYSLDERFLAKVCNSSPFTYTHYDPVNVARVMKENFPTLEIQVKAYRTWNPFSRVIGYAKGNVIYINTRKINLPIRDRVENIMHESLHLIGFRHARDNKAVGDSLKSVPYKVAAIFAEFIFEEDLSILEE